MPVAGRRIAGIMVQLKNPFAMSATRPSPLDTENKKRRTGPSAAAPLKTLDRVTLGKRLRAARHALGWTLVDVMEASGISITTISRAERGQLTLSYEKFSALAHSLKMDLAELFSATGTAATEWLDDPIVTRAGEGVVYRGHSMTYEFLTTQVAGKQMSPIRGVIHARKINGPEDFARHQGEEFLYVLSGKVEVHFADGRRLQLNQGDTMYFDSRIGHAYTSISRRPAEILGACTSESSLMHAAREQMNRQAGTPEKKAKQKNSTE